MPSAQLLEAQPVDGTRGDAPADLPRIAAGAAGDVVAPAERIALWGVVVGLLLAVGVVVTLATYQDLAEYDRTFNDAKGYVGHGTCADNYLLLRAALTPFRSLVVIRNAALFLSFNMVLLGCLFVVAGIRAAYKINVEYKDAKSALDTASPGLVLVTIGALLMGVSLYRTGSPVFQPLPCAPASPVASTMRDLNPPVQ